MPHEVLFPRTAAREEKRQANEALGRSFCKTLAEPITNSDSSYKRRLRIPHNSGLVDLVLEVPKGTQLDTAALRTKLAGRYPLRRITVEVVTSKSSGRQVGEVVIIDQAEGMSPSSLKTALSDIAGDRTDITAGTLGRSLFGRGLSDVLRAHSMEGRPANQQPIVQTFDGEQLTVARGEWQEKKGWTIELSYDEPSRKSASKRVLLDLTSTGTAVRFVISDRARAQGCRIPDHPQIRWRLANFYMLRLIAGDPNVELLLRQYRSQGVIEERIQYDFPVGQVIESFSRTFRPADAGIDQPALQTDFLVVRSDSERPMAGVGSDRDARERGLLIVDDLDAVYDLTFADADYEKADFLARIYGIVRVNGLRSVVETYLNAGSPSSPLRPDRDGFNRDHEFARVLLDFIADQMRPLYEKERKLATDKDDSHLSAQTKRRIDEALKHLNKYFQQITELSGQGTGTPEPQPDEPEAPVAFLPQRTKLVAGRAKQVLLLVRDDAVKSGTDVIVTATDGLAVQPESDRIDRKNSQRWSLHKHFYALPFSVSSSVIGQSGQVNAIVDGKDGELLDAVLQVDDVLAEPMIEVPETLAFRPSESTGRPGRRNNLVLYVNSDVIHSGHYVRVQITKRTGDVNLFDANGQRCEQLDVKLDQAKHGVEGQPVLRVLIPWIGTSWNQHAHVAAGVKIGGGTKFTATATIRLDEPEEGGFFRRVEYQEIDPKAPSQSAAGVITVNINDPLNRHVFGESREEFDRRLSSSPEAQQRLANLLVEEASFRALQERYKDNKVNFATGREIDVIHEEIDRYKFESAVDVYKALTRVRP